jgi:hypothetical protein
MNNRPIIETSIVALAELFNRQLTPGALKLYVNALEGIPLDVIATAIEHISDNCQFFPMPVEFRKLAGVRSDDDHAIGAWDEVLSAISIGPYEWVDFVDGTINATIRNLGGWPSFMSRFSDADSEKWARHEFIKTYQAFRNSGTVAGPLTGLSEKKVGPYGELVDPVPIRIGTDRPDVLKIADQTRADIPRVEFKSI